MGLPVQNVSSSSTWRRWFPGILVLGSVVSLYWGWLALPVGFGCFVAAVTVDSLREHRAPRAGLCIWVAAIVVSAGLTRFVIVEGMSGIVAGGRQAVQRKAVSRLREILFAQDAMRRSGWIDPDGDGIGSAPWLDELCMGKSERGSAKLQAPVLRCTQLIASSFGQVSVEGAYRYAVCLPDAKGGWIAPGEGLVDEERAETQFVAFAWPAPQSRFTAAFFIDERENILTRLVPKALAASESSPQQADWRPTCSSALQLEKTTEWKIWMGKKPRSAL